MAGTNFGFGGGAPGSGGFKLGAAGGFSSPASTTASSSGGGGFGGFGGGGGGAMPRSATAPFSVGSGGGGSGSGFGSNPMSSTFGGFNATAAASAAPAKGGFSLGSGSSAGNTGLGMAKPAAGGFSLGGAPAATTGGMAAAGGFKLGGTAAQAPATAPPAASSAGGFKLGGAAPPAASSAGGFKLGGAAAAPASSAAAGFAAGAPAAGGLKLGFGAPSTTTATASGALKPSGGTSAPGGLKLGFGAAPATTAAASGALKLSGGTSAAGSTSFNAGTTASAQNIKAGEMTYKELEDRLNKWQREIREQQGRFEEQARSVSQWDTILLDNGEKVVQLLDEVTAVSRQQEAMEHELKKISQDQSEMSELLTQLESTLPTDDEVQRVRDPDQERDRMFETAENVHKQLARMRDEIKAMIHDMNQSAQSDRDGEDPVQSIMQILNEHQTSLRWIDTSTDKLQHRLKQLENDRLSQAHQV